MSGTTPSETPLVVTISQEVSRLSNTTEAAIATFGLSPEDYYKIGALMAIVGNIIISVSLNVQKFAHRRQADKSDHTTASLFGPGSYLRSGVWWIGILLMILGEIGNFVAYGFAPASVVAPLGCVAVIANGGLAVVFNNEVLRMQDIMGAAFAVVGSFLIVQFSGQPDTVLNAQQIIEHLGAWQFIIYMFVEVITFSMVLFLRSFKRFERGSVLLHLLLVAILGSFTVISAKAVAGMLTLSIQGDSQFTNAILYVMALILAVTTILQVKYLNEAMAKFDIATVVPINFVFFTISAIIAGAIFYQEFFHSSAVIIAIFMFGCVLSFIGVVFITSDKENSEADPASFHLDMMPNFIRSIAPSLRVLNVQPQSDPNQVTSYPEDTPLSRDKTVTRYDVGAEKVSLPGISSDASSDDDDAPTAPTLTPTGDDAKEIFESSSNIKDSATSDQDCAVEDTK